MKNILLYIMAFSSLLVACDSESDLKPSGAERNWLVVEDSDVPVDHERYLIFKETGIPIYYNDTIGSEERYSLSAREWYTYYEKLQVFYNPGGATPSWTTSNYQVVANPEDVLPVLEFLKADVLNAIPKDMYIASILLVDTLNSTSGTLAHKGFNTVVLSEVKDFAAMTDGEKKVYRGAALRCLVAGSLVATEGDWLEENFYELSYATNPNNIDYIYSTASRSTMVYRAAQGYPLEEQRLATLGFIGTKTKPTGTDERMWYVPEKQQDVSQFCEAVFAYTEAEFIALHGNAPVVMEKFYVLRDKIKEYGFTFE